jgi:hypothetical protein
MITWFLLMEFIHYINHKTLIFSILPFNVA